MAYEPKTWETGEVITAPDLNHMENGIGTFYVTATDVESVSILSASYNDLLDAYHAGKSIVYVSGTDDSLAFDALANMGHNEELGYGATFGFGATAIAFSASDADSNLRSQGGSE